MGSELLVEDGAQSGPEVVGASAARDAHADRRIARGGRADGLGTRGAMAPVLVVDLLVPADPGRDVPVRVEGEAGRGVSLAQRLKEPLGQDMGLGLEADAVQVLGSDLL